MSRVLLMALVGDDDTGESEPVVIDTDEPGVVSVELEDGRRYALDAVELRAAVAPVRSAA